MCRASCHCYVFQSLFVPMTNDKCVKLFLCLVIILNMFFISLNVKEVICILNPAYKNTHEINFILLVFVCWFFVGVIACSWCFCRCFFSTITWWIVEHFEIIICNYSECNSRELYWFIYFFIHLTIVLCFLRQIKFKCK